MILRRAFVASLLALALVRPARAQTGATRTQIDLALAAASLAALRTRYGDSAPDVVASRMRIDALRTALEEARARHETIDVAAVASALEAELADVNARLGEFSSRCGSGHPDMQGARARAAALTDAIAHVTSAGFFLAQ